jgi:hypothetical protein
MGFGFGVTSVEEAGVSVRPGEHWAPLELRGFEELGAALVASGGRGSSAFGDSPPGWESFARESESIS